MVPMLYIKLRKHRGMWANVHLTYVMMVTSCQEVDAQVVCHLEVGPSLFLPAKDVSNYIR